MGEAAPAISLQGVGVRRGEGWILQGVDWIVSRGACVAILGPNGSGKSTLARILAGYLWPSEGEVAVLGARYGEVSLPDLRRSIRMVQPAGPYDVDPQLTTREVVLTGMSGTIGLYETVPSESIAQADWLLGQVGLSHVVDHSYSTLSSGERVRALMARALIVRPGLLLLDEPTAGLDLLAREQVLGVVQRMTQAKLPAAPTTVLITHHVEELPPATSDILLLSEGRVAARGAPADVIRSDVLSSVYRCPVSVRRSNGRFYVEVPPQAWENLLDRP